MTDRAHHTDSGFRNLYLERFDTSLWQFLKMRIAGKEAYADWSKQADRVPRVPVDIERITRAPDAPQVTWLGHSSSLVQYAGMNVLFDPVFSERVSPVSFLGPRRVVPAPLALDELPDIHAVFISHNHYDHLDRHVVKALGNGPLWCVPLGLKQWLTGLGIAKARIVELDWWETHEIGASTVTATPAQHWSGRGLRDRCRTLWSGWAIEWADFRCWYSGDTGYARPIFTTIGRRLEPLDLAIIPIGAYAPRWFMQAQHVNPEEAVQIFSDVGARRAIGVHWGVFQLSAEPIDEPPRRLQAAAASAGLAPEAFVAPALGETIVVQSTRAPTS
jgi:N-acyl-phosphatidylethanolamine-hydrolysing phospholipase D